MKRSRLLIVGLLTLILSAIVVIVAARRENARPTLRSTSTTHEQAVAQFFAGNLPDVDGQTRPFSAWQGQTLVINFWATWCPPCRDEMPAFSRLHQLYAAQGVQFVGIALDAADRVRAYARQYPVSYPLLIGGSTGVDLARLFGNDRLGLPYTVLITRQREARVLRAGPLSENELNLILQETLKR